MHTLSPTFSVDLPEPLVLASADAPAAALQAAAVQRLTQHGYALLAPDAVARLSAATDTDLYALTPLWNHLEADEHMKDGGRYRQRRHASYIQTQALAAGTAAPTTGGTALTAVPHRPHWQPTTYNALHGGMLRWFAPVEPAMAQDPAFLRVIAHLGTVFGAAAQAGANPAALPSTQAPWFIEVHPFRIDTAGGVGRPTPEGAHRDGVDYVAVILIAREGVRGGETRVFEADSLLGLRFTLEAPWTALLLDDHRVIHETTPIVPVDPDTHTGHRDTLVITYRRGGFQDPPN